MHSSVFVNETQSIEISQHSPSSSSLVESKFEELEGGEVMKNMNMGASRGVNFKSAEQRVDSDGSSQYLEIDGEQLVNFGTCHYLGLQSHPQLIEGACSVARKHGVQFTISRAYLQTGLYDKLENLLSVIFKKPVLATKCTTLGHQAALPVLVGDDDVVILDMQVHSSVQTAAQLLKERGVKVIMVRHNDMKSLKKKIERLRHKHGKVWYLADGLYSMYGDEAPFSELKELLDQYENFHLYVDDAHGTSWTGENGSGIARKYMEHHDRMVMAVSLSKSFGADGAALVFANEHQKQLVKKLGGPMIFTGPIQPPMLGVACASAEWHLSPALKERQTELNHIIDHCNTAIDKYNLPQFERNGSPIFFIPVGQAEMASEIVKRVKNDGYYINWTAYPAVPKNKAGLRFMMNYHLSSENVDNMLKSIRKHYKNILIENGVKEIDISEKFDIPSFQL